MTIKEAIIKCLLKQSPIWLMCVNDYLFSDHGNIMQAIYIINTTKDTITYLL